MLSKHSIRHILSGHSKIAETYQKYFTNFQNISTILPHSNRILLNYFLTIQCSTFNFKTPLHLHQKSQTPFVWLLIISTKKSTILVTMSLHQVPKILNFTRVPLSVKYNHERNYIKVKNSWVTSLNHREFYSLALPSGCVVSLRAPYVRYIRIHIRAKWLFARPTRGEAPRGEQ